MKKHKNITAFTVAELMISTGVVIILLFLSANIFSNLFKSINNIKASNAIQNEARFLMERIAREIRAGSIDYEEYFNQSNNFFGDGLNETYGQNYCSYSREFYSPGPDLQYGTYDDESTGKRNEDTNPAINKELQKNLYLIDNSGTKRTYIKRYEVEDKNGKKIGKIAMLKLNGYDYGIDHIPNSLGGMNCKADSGERDGLIDTWLCADGFTCYGETITTDTCEINNWKDIIIDNPAKLNQKMCAGDHDKKCINNNDCNSVGGPCIEATSFVDITPPSLNIVDLDFYITPEDDPRKSYADPNVQIQPEVSIKLTVKANNTVDYKIKDKIPDIILSTSVSTRSQAEIITECNLQECINGDVKLCPKTQGVCAVKLNSDGKIEEGYKGQTCIQGKWSGCTEEDYKINAGKEETYEANTEFSSCKTKNTQTEIDKCKNERCTDGVDNDCDGKTDVEDGDCLWELCTNGVLDPGEICIDVGGPCYFHPLLNKESPDACYDNLDNDCSYNFDMEWSSISEENKEKIKEFGLTKDNSIAEWNIALGLGADEYDQNCREMICNDGKKSENNKNIENSNFGPKSYDTPYYLFGKNKEPNELAEKCKDIGGLCEYIKGHKKSDQEATDNQTTSLCYDGLDNDCDGRADELDTTGTTISFDCANDICKNNKEDTELIEESYIDDTTYFLDYILGYSDGTNKDNTKLDEKCKDRGGICKNIYPDQGLGTKEKAITGDPNGCFDGIDNNCDGKTDGTNSTDPFLTDESCCPRVNNNGTTFFSILGMKNNEQFCTIKDKQYDVKKEYPYGMIDCAPEDNNIYPKEKELTCGDGIDDNCSGINGIDNGNDNEEEECCLDNDKDGYGAEGYNVHIVDTDGNPTNNCKNADKNNNSIFTYFDCNDTQKTVYPGSPENTKDLCSDSLNNNCRKNSNKDHIDMFNTNPHTSTAFDLSNFDVSTSNLYTAYTNHSFEELCKDLTSNETYNNLEICDDTDNLRYYRDHTNTYKDSDNNSNGLSSYDDFYCLSSDLHSFYDNFSTSTYIDLSNTTAEYKQIAFPNPSYKQSKFIIKITGGNIITSKLIPTASCGTKAITSVSIESSDNLFITYQVSNDGGLTYEDYTKGSEHTFTSSGNKLKWKAKLDNGKTKGELNAIKINFTCN